MGRLSGEHKAFLDSIRFKVAERQRVKELELEQQAQDEAYQRLKNQRLKNQQQTYKAYRERRKATPKK